MQQITVDINPGNNKKTPIFNASQYDVGREFRANLVENLVPYTLDGTELLSISVRKGDNTLFTADVGNTFGGKSYVDFVSTEQMCAVAGYNFGELTIEKNNTRIGTVNFMLVCEPSPEASGLTSESEINNLNRQIDDYLDETLPEQVEEVAPAIVEEIAPDVVREVAPAVIEDVAPPILERLAPSVVREVAPPIVEELVPIAVGDNYYNKTQTDAKIAGLIDDTQASASKVYSSEKVEELVSKDYAQKLTQTLKVGENILTEASVVLGANWSGTLAGGLSHSSGSTEPLEFNVPTTSGKAYLVTFNATNVNSASAILTRIGDTPDVDVYNGTTDFYIGIVADGGNLIITPKSNFSGTITNLKLREVADEGDEVTFEVKNVNTNEKESGISGFWNVVIGVNNFSNNENGSRNIALGFASLNAFKSGTRNIAVGTFAMNRLESGDMNIAVGADSMWYTKKAKDCIALGANSMNGVGTDLEHNIAIGQDSMVGLTTGKQNVAIGYGSMAVPQTTGVNNATCIGAQSGNYVNSGSTYIGQRAGYHLKGVNNTCLGLSAGAQQNATGEYNTFVGVQCGIDNTGATASNPKVVNNSIAIGRQARATKSNQMMLGSADITEVVMCGNKKIKFNNDGTVTWEILT